MPLPQDEYSRCRNRTSGELSDVEFRARDFSAVFIVTNRYTRWRTWMYQSDRAISQRIWRSIRLATIPFPSRGRKQYRETISGRYYERPIQGQYSREPSFFSGLASQIQFPYSNSHHIKRHLHPVRAQELVGWIEHPILSTVPQHSTCRT
jgi:hypothetical protein